MMKDMKRGKFYIIMITAFAIALLFLSNEAVASNSLSLQDITMQKGGTAFLSIQMTNDDPITGFQCDLYLPKGMTLENNSILLGRTDTSKHGVTTHKMGDGYIRIVCASATNATFSGNNGEVLLCRLNSTLGIGQYEMTLKNIVLTDPDANRFTSDDVSAAIVIMDSNKLELQDVVLPNDNNEQALPIYMSNESEISGFQCDLYLPEGIEVVKNENDEFKIDLARTSTDNHSVISRQMEDGGLRIICNSTKDVSFSGNSGEVLIVWIKFSLSDGSYGAKLKNIILTNTDAARFTSNDVSCNISIVPPFYTITYVLDGEVYATETLECGTKIVPPVIPGLEDYTIWEDVPETMPAKDITIYGKAKEIIDSLTPNPSPRERGAVYDLSGRKMFNVQSSMFNGLKNGIYIQNGRKVAVK